MTWRSAARQTARRRAVRAIAGNVGFDYMVGWSARRSPASARRPGHRRGSRRQGDLCRSTALPHDASRGSATPGGDRRWRRPDQTGGGGGAGRVPTGSGRAGAGLKNLLEWPASSFARRFASRMIAAGSVFASHRYPCAVAEMRMHGSTRRVVWKGRSHITVPRPPLSPALSSGAGSTAVRRAADGVGQVGSCRVLGRPARRCRRAAGRDGAPVAEPPRRRPPSARENL